MCKFVVDTNVLLLDYRILSDKFPGKDLIIPFVVLQELDSKKAEDSLIGYNSRKCIQFIESIKDNDGNYNDGIVREKENGKLILLSENYISEKSYSNDRNIIECTRLLGEDHVLLTNDKYMRILCEMFEIKSVEYENGKNRKILTHHRTIELKHDELNTLITEGSLDADDFDDFYSNEYFHVFNDNHSDYHVKAQYVEFSGTRFAHIKNEQTVHGVTAKNHEQDFLIDAIQNHPITIGMGPAGTGKTLLSLACALSLFESNTLYKRILLLKPLSTIGRDIGYLPGDKDEKIEPFFASFADNLDYIYRNTDYDPTNDYIDFEPLTHMRGRSLNNYIVILDEAQNITKLEMKSLGSRIGYNSKLIVLGDITQIDEHYLNKNNNGLNVLNNHFQGKPEAACVFLHKSERSRISELFEEL